MFNLKLYVGQPTKPIEKRFLQHAKANSPLGEAMRQCGLENFTIDIIEVCNIAELARQREMFWIKVLKCKMPNGYNRSNGDESVTYKPKPSLTLVKKEPSQIKCGIGKKLRERRNELSLTQRQVANFVGVTVATVSRWETGDIDNMRRDKIAKLADVLKLSPLLIMGDDNFSCAQFPPTSEELNLIDDCRTLATEDKNFVTSMVKRLRTSIPPVVTMGSEPISIPTSR